jgi:hypothetical protein
LNLSPRFSSESVARKRLVFMIANMKGVAEKGEVKNEWG